MAGGYRGFSELSVRASEFTAAPEGVSRAYVIENEITYLAFPVPDGAMVIFGGGYAVPVLAPLGWLAGLDLVYWGDIDTHGFAILNRLRHHLPHARSMLMDRATLLDHRDHWTTEPSPTAAALDRLDAAESALYADLVSDAYGSVRPPRAGTDQLRRRREGTRWAGLLLYCSMIMVRAAAGLGSSNRLVVSYCSMIMVRAAAGLGSSNRLVVTSCSRIMVSVAGDPGISSGEVADGGPGFFTGYSWRDEPRQLSRSGRSIQRIFDHNIDMTLVSQRTCARNSPVYFWLYLQQTRYAFGSNRAVSEYKRRAAAIQGLQ